MSHERLRGALDLLDKAALVDLVLLLRDKVDNLRVMNAVLLTNDAAQYARFTAKLFTTPTTNCGGEESPPTSSNEAQA